MEENGSRQQVQTVARFWHFLERQDLSSGSWQRSMVSQYQNKRALISNIHMRPFFSRSMAVLAFVTASLLLTSATTRSWPEIFTKPKVLIFCKTNGYHHASIAAGTVAIKKLGEENGFDVDVTEDSTQFRFKILKKYSAL